MAPLDLLPPLQGPALIVVLVAALGAIGAIVGGGLALSGRAVPTPLLVLPAAAPFTAAVGLAAAPGAPFVAVARWIGLHVLTFWVALVPVGFTVLLLGAVGARARPWRPVGAGLCAVAVAATAGVTVAGGIVEEDLVFPVLRAGVYAVFGAAVCAALLAGGDPTGPGRRAAPAAAISWVILVALGEGASQGLVFLHLLMGVADLPDADRRAFLALGRAEVVVPMARWSWATVGAGAGVGLVGLLPAIRPSPPRVFAVGTVFVGLALVLAGWRLGSPDDAALLAVAGPGPIPAGPAVP